MANYATGRWETFNHVVSDMMKKPEFKHKPSNTLMKYMKSGTVLFPAGETERVRGIKTSDQQQADIHILTNALPTTASARAAAHTGNIADDKGATLSFTTYAATFKYSLKMADRTFWELAELIAARVKSASIALHNSIETDLLTALNTNKTQVVESTSPASGDWDATNYIFGILNADEDYFMQRMSGFMRENYYGGLIEAVLDEGLFQRGQRIVQQGQGNSENLQWQANGIDATNSVELTPDSGYLGMGYMFQEGSVGLVDWIPSINKAGSGSSEREVGGIYASIPDPLGSGLQFAVHEYATAADNDGTYGETQDVNIQVELSVDIASVVAPMSTSNAHPIIKLGLKE